MTRTIATPGTAVVTLLAATLAILNQSCRTGPGILPPGDRAWVATEPVQCLGNPWERDWLARYGDIQPYPGYPGAEERIIREYYAGIGVEVGEIVSIPKYQAVCEACSCPRGDVLYLSVREGDVDTMIRLGFRLESPSPFPRDTALLGAYRYTGYDGAGTVPLFHGTLTFLSRETTFVSGAWRIDGPEGYGPQVGTGTFEGGIHGSVVRLNLNPGWADNNVLLRGELKAGTYAGAWEVVTIAGVVYVGRFVAVKLPLG